MQAELEIEYKNLLTAEEYHRLLKDFKAHYPVQSWSQENYYFDTPQLALKRQQSALRIRLFDKKTAEITLKIPYQQHLLEFNQNISYSEAKRMLEGEQLALPDKLHEQIEKMTIDPSNLIYHCFMKTFRSQLEDKNQNFQIALDYSSYQQANDYELEVEGQTEDIALHLFDSILKKYNIERRPSQSKIARAFSYRGQ